MTCWIHMGVKSGSGSGSGGGTGSALSGLETPLLHPFCLMSGSTSSKKVTEPGRMLSDVFFDQTRVTTWGGGGGGSWLFLMLKTEDPPVLDGPKAYEPWSLTQEAMVGPDPEVRVLRSGSGSRSRLSSAPPRPAETFLARFFTSCLSSSSVPSPDGSVSRCPPRSRFRTCPFPPAPSLLLD